MPDITIAIADPHPVVRAGIGAFCRAQPGWRVTGECETGDQLHALVSMAAPRYAILDPAIFPADADEFAANVRAIRTVTRLIVRGDSRDASSVRSMLRAGLSAYTLKDSPAGELISAVARVESGFTYISPLIQPPVDDAAESPDPQKLLSEREYQVFLGLGSGERARDVAVSLGLSPKTVDTYRASILRKLDLDGLASLVRLAAMVGRNQR